MTPRSAEQTHSAASLRAAFDAAPAYTLGIEEELLLLDPLSLELAPAAEELLARLDGDPRFKLELPASQIEILTPPSERPAEAAQALIEARRHLAQRGAGLVLIAGAGVHPFSSGIGRLNHGARYAATIAEYGAVAARQLVCALQVHVAIGGADRALAVYNAARSYLPLLAALAANAPFYEGRDSGLASVRPQIGGLLPRQGVPPAFRSWEAVADTLAWGAATGAFAKPQTWWWELRLHPRFGTLEFRVPDAQSTVHDAEAIAAAIQALAAWLGDRHDAGERLAVAPRWRIEENRWSACRHGVGGTMVSLEAGERFATSELLQELLEQLDPVARRFGSSRALAHARSLAERNGAIAQREVAAQAGVRAVGRWLAERFLAPRPG